MSASYSCMVGPPLPTLHNSDHLECTYTRVRALWSSLPSTPCPAVRQLILSPPPLPPPLVSYPFAVFALPPLMWNRRTHRTTQLLEFLHSTYPKGLFGADVVSQLDMHMHLLSLSTTEVRKGTAEDVAPKRRLAVDSSC